MSSLWRVPRGKELKLGDARISLGDGGLVMEDPYSSRSIPLDVDEVSVRPYPPIYVPTKVTDYLMIKMDRPIVPRDGQEIWLSAPYDLAVELDGSVLGFASPFRVKYILYGPNTEGIVCRYHVSGGSVSGMEAKVKVLFKVRRSKYVDRIVLPVRELEIFSDNNSIYYEIVEVSVDEDLFVELKNQSPVEAELVYSSEKNLSLVKRLLSSFRMVW